MICFASNTLFSFREWYVLHQILYFHFENDMFCIKYSIFISRMICFASNTLFSFREWYVLHQILLFHFENDMFCIKYSIFISRMICFASNTLFSFREWYVLHQILYFHFENDMFCIKYSIFISRMICFASNTLFSFREWYVLHQILYFISRWYVLHQILYFHFENDMFCIKYSIFISRMICFASIFISRMICFASNTLFSFREWYVLHQILYFHFENDMFCIKYSIFISWVTRLGAKNHRGRVPRVTRLGAENHQVRRRKKRKSRGRSFRDRVPRGHQARGGKYQARGPRDNHQVEGGGGGGGGEGGGGHGRKSRTFTRGWGKNASAVGICARVAPLTQKPKPIQTRLSQPMNPGGVGFFPLTCSWLWVLFGLWSHWQWGMMRCMNPRAGISTTERLKAEAAKSHCIAAQL